MRVAGNDWDEDLITYDSAPGRLSGVIANHGVDTAGWLDVDVTSAFESIGTITFVLSGRGNAVIEFGSRESDAGPELIIDMPQPVPTPMVDATATPTATMAGADTSTPTPTATPTVIVTATPTPTPSPAADEAPLERTLTNFAIIRSGESLAIPLYVSQPVTIPDDSVRIATIVVHGSSRNADDYWTYAAESMEGTSGTLVIAPKFATLDDEPAEDQIYWSPWGWPVGNLSHGLDRPWRISSYEVMDELIGTLYATFPNLEHLVVAGHSAGGQFVNRYAAASSEPRNHYLVMNPSSYLYWSAERPTEDGFSTPSTSCTGYNEYKYGLDRLSATSYMNLIGADELFQRYGSARVTYLIGEEDNDPDDSWLDTSCEGMLQGAHRLARAQYYYDHVGEIFGSDAYENHELGIVPGVGHSAKEMLASAHAREVLLGR